MIHPTDTPATFTAVSGHTRLFRRNGGTYYLRAKVPALLRPIIKKTEERVSLRTKDQKEALKKVKIESLRVDREFEAAGHTALLHIVDALPRDYPGTVGLLSLLINFGCATAHRNPPEHHRRTLKSLCDKGILELVPKRQVYLVTEPYR